MEGRAMSERTTNWTVIITGDTDSSGRFIVLFNEFGVELPQYRFLALLVLIIARLCTLTGRAELTDFEGADVVFGKTSLHKVIQRLRDDLNSRLGAGFGDQLVLHNGRSRYSIAVDRDAIAVSPTFRELKREIGPLIYNKLETLIDQSLSVTAEFNANSTAS